MVREGLWLKHRDHLNASVSVVIVTGYTKFLAQRLTRAREVALADSPLALVCRKAARLVGRGIKSRDHLLPPYFL